MDSVVKEARQAAGKPVPNDPIWSPGPVGDPAVNLWKRHWQKHAHEFPDLAGPVAYVDRAMDFVSQSNSGGSRRVLEGIDSQGRTIRVVWDRNNGLNDYGVATINPDGSLGPVSSYYRLDRATLETKYELRDLPGGKDVFERYFEENGPAGLANVQHK